MKRYDLSQSVAAVAAHTVINRLRPPLSMRRDATRRRRDDDNPPRASPVRQRVFFFFPRILCVRAPVFFSPSSSASSSPSARFPAVRTRLTYSFSPRFLVSFSFFRFLSSRHRRRCRRRRHCHRRRRHHHHHRHRHRGGLPQSSVHTDYDGCKLRPRRAARTPSAGPHPFAANGGKPKLRSGRNLRPKNRPRTAEKKREEKKRFFNSQSRRSARLRRHAPLLLIQYYCFCRCCCRDRVKYLPTRRGWFS